PPAGARRPDDTTRLPDPKTFRSLKRSPPASFKRLLGSPTSPIGEPWAKRERRPLQCQHGSWRSNYLAELNTSLPKWNPCQRPQARRFGDRGKCCHEPQACPKRCMAPRAEGLAKARCDCGLLATIGRRSPLCYL